MIGGSTAETFSAASALSVTEYEAAVLSKAAVSSSILPSMSVTEREGSVSVSPSADTFAAYVTVIALLSEKQDQYRPVHQPAAVLAQNVTLN